MSWDTLEKPCYGSLAHRSSAKPLLLNRLMQMRSQRRGSIHYILNVLLYVIIFLAAISFMLNNMMSLPTPIGIVVSGSMVPTMRAGDIVFIQPLAIEEAKVGDIIAFYAPPDEKTVIHRVARVIHEGKIYLRTKGDANPVEDQEFGGWIGVDNRRLIGKIYCLDGHPLRLPRLGFLLIEARNFSIWLTQNKIWSFWAPMLAILFIFGPYLTPAGLGQFNFRGSLRVKIPTKTLFTYSLVAMCAISAFTIYFRTEEYTLTMRVASLLEPWRGYIYYGSMGYGEVKNNTLSVSGPPLFPVKTFVWVRGNASALITPLPRATKIEPNTLNDLILQAEIPVRGEVEPGPYDGRVYIFSDTLLLILPDEIIFFALNLIPNPWIAVAFLDVLMALTLAVLLASGAWGINWASSQILYTILWRERLKTGLAAFRIKLHHFMKKVGYQFQRISDKAAALYSVMKKEVKLKGMLKLTGIAIVPATALFLLRDNVLLPIITLGLALGILAKTAKKERSEIIFGGALANLFFSIIFIVRRGVVFLYSAVNPYWSVVSAGLVGGISFFTTLPIVIGVTLLSAIGLKTARSWYLEQQISNWQVIKPAKITIEQPIKIPSLKEFEELQRRRLAVDVSVGTFFPLKVKSQNLSAKLLRKTGAFFTTIWIEIRLTIQYLRGKEIKFFGMHRSFITYFNEIKSKANSVKSRVNHMIENAWWMLRLLSYRVISVIKREGSW